MEVWRAVDTSSVGRMCLINPTEVQTIPAPVQLLDRKAVTRAQDATSQSQHKDTGWTLEILTIITISAGPQSKKTLACVHIN